VSEEIKIELKKPLEKMTAKELRQLVIEQIPQITGASGMTKEELLANIKEVLGITEEEGKSNAMYKSKIRELKQKIRELKAAKLEAKSNKEREIIRKKIHRLKRQTRRLASA
jgi:cell division protein FtsX